MSLAVDLINRILQKNSVERERLRHFHGKTVRLSIAPWHAVCTIGEDGNVRRAQGGAPLDAEIAISPVALLRLLGQQRLDPSLVQISGNPELAAEIGVVLQNLKWEVEKDLARTLGRRLFELPRHVVHEAAQTFAEYVTEEHPLVAKKENVRKFVQQVDEVRDAAARLEKRLERLEKR